jgi:hypothetical protein
VTMIRRAPSICNQRVSSGTGIAPGTCCAPVIAIPRLYRILKVMFTPAAAAARTASDPEW